LIERVRKACTLVGLAAQLGHLTFADAFRPERLDQIVDRTGPDALDVVFLDDLGQRLLGHPPRVLEAREIAALAKFRDAQFHRAGAGDLVAVPKTVAMIRTLGAALAVAGAA